ncbi:MAG: flagellar basal-body MS-ring/collar protein FliF [Rhodomicrobium sp.]
MAAAGDQLERLWTSLIGLGPQRLAALGAVGIAIFAFVGFGSYYLSRPDLEVLYIGLSPSDIARVGAVLHEAGISFDANAEGTKVFVKRGEAAKARMLLAERGLPNSSTAGYELFDKLGSMGLTSFMQNITHVRALEGEIARSIQAMKGVQAARVHLVLPDPGSFRQAPQLPSASVVIRANSGQLASAAAIRQLVSSAIPGMTPERVAVLSTDGTILAAGGETGGVSSGKALELEKEVSREIDENIRKTLVPFLGMGNFEASVSTRLNLDKKQISETAFDPESKVERSTKTIKESGSSQNSNGKWNVSVEQNVPGSEANTGTNKPSDQNRRSNERKEEITNFEVSSKTTSTVSDGYRIENIAVAVVVNRKHLLSAAADKNTGVPVEEQIKSVERLVASAAGIVPARGDKVTVAAVDFAAGNELEPVPAPSVWEQLAGQAGSYVVGAAILLSTIIFISLGLRPALRLLLDNKQPAIDLQAPQLAAEGAPALSIEGSEAALALQKLQPPDAIATASSKKQSLMKQVEKAIAANEQQAIEVLKEWIKES